MTPEQKKSNQRLGLILGVVALVIEDNVGAIVKLKSETDFVASSEHFKSEATELAHLVARKGEAAVAERAAQLEDLKITLKEKIEKVMVHA